MKTKLPVILTLITSIALITAGCATTCPDEGGQAPDFTLTNLDGESISLSDFRGKPVIINLWSTRCIPCVGEMPHIQAVYNKRSSQGLVILAINVSDSTAVAREFISSKGYTFTALLDPQNKVSQKYCLPQAIPITLFIDSEGTIKKTRIGAFQSPEEIESILDSL